MTITLFIIRIFYLVQNAVNFINEQKTKLFIRIVMCWGFFLLFNCSFCFIKTVFCFNLVPGPGQTTIGVFKLETNKTIGIFQLVTKKKKIAGVRATNWIHNDKRIQWCSHCENYWNAVLCEIICFNGCLNIQCKEKVYSNSSTLCTEALVQNEWPRLRQKLHSSARIIGRPKKEIKGHQQFQ